MLMLRHNSDCDTSWPFHYYYYYYFDLSCHTCGQWKLSGASNQLQTARIIPDIRNQTFKIRQFSANRMMSSAVHWTWCRKNISCFLSWEKQMFKISLSPSKEAESCTFRQRKTSPRFTLKVSERKWCWFNFVGLDAESRPCPVTVWSLKLGRHPNSKWRKRAKVDRLLVSACHW